MEEFSIRQTRSGYSFILKANHDIIVVGKQEYPDIESIKNAIADMRTLASKAAVIDLTENAQPSEESAFELYADKAGEFRFRLKNADDDIIIVSEGFSKKESALKRIELVRKLSKDAIVTLFGRPV